MEKKALFAPVWRHWKHAFREYRSLVIGTMASYGVTTYLNDVYKATLWQRIVDQLGKHQNPFGLFMWIPIVGIITFFINRIGDYCITRSESGIIKYLKDYALERIVNYETNFFISNFAGSIVAKARRFATVSEQVYDDFAFIILRVFVVLTGVFLVALHTIPIVGFILLGWSVIFGYVAYRFSKYRSPHDLASAEADSDTTGHQSDIIGASQMIQAYSREYVEFGNFTNTTEIEHQKRLKKWLIKNRQWAVSAILVLLLEGILMYLVIEKSIEGQISVGVVVLVQSYIASVSGYMWQFGRSIANVQNNFADANEMAVLLSEKMDMQAKVFKPTKRASDIHSFTINFSNIHFTYPEKAEKVLHGTSFVLEEGKRYGMVGKTGSGKSTITRLLIRQHDIESGDGVITIGGVSIYDVSKSDLCSLISWVPQDPHFPFRTIRDIISFGNSKASEEKIIHAAKQAACHDFIVKLEKGYDTNVGERGVKLSGGERQRLALAAAILKDAPIFILDEPTSALDSETEDAIQNVLSGMPNKTMIVIAHRLSTVAELDEILVLRDGNISERGSHADLIYKNGQYASLWKKQFRY